MTLALIPARGGSKGIKKKNLTLLQGKPLLYYTINAAKNSKYIDKIVLSSDCDEILNYGKSQDIEILKRPREFALDNTTSDKVILHSLQFYKEYDNIILLQPTSPLRTTSHIDEAFEFFEKEKADSIISVCECDNKILKAFVNDEKDYLKGICNNDYSFMSRQKLPKTYISNGAIYILKIKTFLTNPHFLQEKTKYYLMDEKSSIYIDTLEDFKKAAMLLEITQ